MGTMTDADLNAALEEVLASFEAADENMSEREYELARGTKAW
ncbi:hypothetical protein [Kitasatospora sp. NPDC093558]